MGVDGYQVLNVRLDTATIHLVALRIESIASSDRRDPGDASPQSDRAANLNFHAGT